MILRKIEQIFVVKRGVFLPYFLFNRSDHHGDLLTQRRTWHHFYVLSGVAADLIQQKSVFHTLLLRNKKLQNSISIQLGSLRTRSLFTYAFRPYGYTYVSAVSLVG